jgi:hypothetical protein
MGSGSVVQNYGSGCKLITDPPDSDLQHWWQIEACLRQRERNIYKKSNEVAMSIIFFLSSFYEPSTYSFRKYRKTSTSRM